MKKSVLIASLFIGLATVGCANKDIYRGDVYTGDQTKEARSISYGTIVSTKPVTIQAPNQGVIGTVGGGALGGILGSGVGGGTGNAIATAVGAIAGVVIGNTVEQKASQTNGVQMVIRKDDGKEIVVVQKADARLVPGARVQIIGGASLNVMPL
ncbi:outer membrane lipoprotein [Spirabiliibacterium falconis]|uniref:glycine zipper 2TM domain-containing protein n=1 Tax=Spirabiliibacterium falconis TaxID=572023 RepID=UPI001AACBDB4|nr:glycine zipper 2TM domain-containing protein [Spirabiliibacterium falconis]MBE2894146.1 glycine zipper 2TM domain-containing protein [Spirabiliibacterium falconis]